MQSHARQPTFSTIINVLPALSILDGQPAPAQRRPSPATQKMATSSTAASAHFARRPIRPFLHAPQLHLPFSAPKPTTSARVNASPVHQSILSELTAKATQMPFLVSQDITYLLEMVSPAIKWIPLFLTAHHPVTI
jgi:hypothetical protein